MLPYGLTFGGVRLGRPLAATGLGHVEITGYLPAKVLVNGRITVCKLLALSFVVRLCEAVLGATDAHWMSPYD
jgi:hypothetical protein